MTAHFGQRKSFILQRWHEKLDLSHSVLVEQNIRHPEIQNLAQQSELWKEVERQEFGRGYAELEG
jgi:hypothetical protein